MKVKLVSSTQVDQDYAADVIEDVLGSMTPDEAREVMHLLDNPEGLMTYIARVSSPKQTNPSYAKLLRFCADNGHWSVFQMVDATFEIETSRMLAPQILRHSSFAFQEFSQRYSAVSADGIETYVARRQDNKNRQNSIDDLSSDIKQEWEKRQLDNWKSAFEHYKWALDNDIAKECARAVLPLQTKTKLYMKGSLRSWVHYLSARIKNGAQKEHTDIAVAIRDVLAVKFPTIAEAMGWSGQ